MKNVLIYANEGRDRGLCHSVRLAELLRAEGLSVFSPAEKELPGASPLDRSEAALADLTVVLGGDGTVIRAAHWLEGLEVPLVGVNLGHLGYMTEISENESAEQLKRVLRGEFRVEKRMKLEAVLRWADGCEETLRAVNDFVLRRSDYSGAISFSAEVNGVPLTDFRGDGLIVATPNGSTGYNLSAGGPILNPAAENLILTPLCNHSITARSFVLAGSDRVTLRVAPAEYQDAPLFSCDSFEHRRIEQPCVITLRKSADAFCLIRLGEESFFRVFEEKMGR